MDNYLNDKLEPPYTITKEESDRLDKLYSLEEILMKIQKLPLFGIYDNTEELVKGIKTRIEEIRNND